MAEPSDHLVEYLRTEIVSMERFAADLVGYAATVRSIGHDEAATRLLHLSRRYRVSALDLQGQLAAAMMKVEG